MLDPWFLETLVCPRDLKDLQLQGDVLCCELGHCYPVVDGVPVMLLDDVEQTMDIIAKSVQRAKGNASVVDQRLPEFYLETLGISEAEKQKVIELAMGGSGTVDPVVSLIVAATSGYLYKDLIGKLSDYPIPELRLPNGDGKCFLDIGCNWGRWCIAAARKGYQVVGIDPSLGAIMAARRVAKQMNLPIRYVVADARSLPFQNTSFDTIFSYSVLQHLSRENVAMIVNQIARLLKNNGQTLIQMPNQIGLRNFQHMLKRGFREAQGFEVRYWSISSLRKLFSKVGSVSVTVDGYFGLGIQKQDIHLLPKKMRFVVLASETLRGWSLKVPLLIHVADSLYIFCKKTTMISVFVFVYSSAIMYPVAALAQAWGAA